MRIMKNKRYLESTGRKWLRRSLIILFILMISCFILALYFYYDLNNSRTSGFEETENVILDQTAITEVNHIERFHGAEAYHVVYGTNSEGAEKIILYPLEGTEKNITTIDTSEIIPKESVGAQWSEQCTGCELAGITPALIDGEALWELTYYDSNNEYVMDYFSMYDGSNYHQFRFD